MDTHDLIERELKQSEKAKEFIESANPEIMRELLHKIRNKYNWLSYSVNWFICDEYDL